MDPVLREQVGDHVIRVLWDESGDSADPRDADNLGIMLCWHPEYILGDEQFKSPAGRGAIARGKEATNVGSAETMAEVATYLRRKRRAINLIPLFLYDHSGISMSAGATIPEERPADDDETSVARGSFGNRTSTGGYSWDTSMVGFMFTTKARIKELGAPADDVDRQLRGELHEYNDYLTGQVFGYVVTKKHEADCDDDECDHDEDVDSCWGFLGDPAEVMKEAKASIPVQA